MSKTQEEPWETMTNNLLEIATEKSGGDLLKAQQRIKRDNPNHQCQEFIRHCRNHIIRLIKPIERLQIIMPKNLKLIPKGMME